MVSLGDMDGKDPSVHSKLRTYSYFPSSLEPLRRAEQALLTVVQQAYVEGVSIHKVDELLQAIGKIGNK